MFTFIGKIFTFFFDIVLYIPRRIPIIKWLFLKPQPKVDLTANIVSFLPEFFCDKKAFLKAFRDVFGQDCELLLQDKKIIFTEYTYYDVWHVRANFFEKEKEFFELLKKMKHKHHFDNSFYGISCMINDSSYHKMLKYEKYFKILSYQNFSSNVLYCILENRDRHIVREIFNNNVLAANAEIRCACGADLSKTIDEDFDCCMNCGRNIENAISSDVEPLLPEIRKQIAKEKKSYRKELGVTDDAA